MHYIGSLKDAEKHISAKIFKENLHTSVKILQICMDLQDSVQPSLQNPAENILQICTDSQRSKTWDAAVTNKNYKNDSFRLNIFVPATIYMRTAMLFFVRSIIIVYTGIFELVSYYLQFRR